MAYATEAPAAHAAAATAQDVVFMRDGVLGVLARIPALWARVKNSSLHWRMRSSHVLRCERLGGACKRMTLGGGRGKVRTEKGLIYFLTGMVLSVD